MSEQYTNIMIGSGEWFPSVKKALDIIGTPIESSGQRSYQFFFADDIRPTPPPLRFLVVRANDVPQNLVNSNITCSAGFTGTDIVEEYRLGVPLTLIERAWTFPLRQLVSDAPNPSISLGLTPNYIDSSPKKPTDVILSDAVIYTPYPRLAKDRLRDLGIDISDTQFETRQGKIEGMWQLDPRCRAVVDISSTGTTAKANQIRVMPWSLFRPEYALFQRPYLSSSEQQRIADFTGIIDERTTALSEPLAEANSGSYRN